MDAEIRIDSDQVGVERSVMDLRQRQAIWENRLSKLLLRTHDQVGGIEQPWLVRDSV